MSLFITHILCISKQNIACKMKQASSTNFPVQPEPSMVISQKVTLSVIILLGLKNNVKNSLHMPLSNLRSSNNKTNRLYWLFWMTVRWCRTSSYNQLSWWSVWVTFPWYVLFTFLALEQSINKMPVILSSSVDFICSKPRLWQFVVINANLTIVLMSTDNIIREI